MSTPHNNGNVKDIAKTVIMPGDPLRVKFIAEHYLTSAKMFTSIRNMYGYTGEYQGYPVTVMGSGMGIPSMGIYSYELFRFYDVENIIRVGSAGSYCEELKVFDTLLVTESYSESTYAQTQNGFGGDTVYPSEELSLLVQKSAEELGKDLKEGKIHSTDAFYRDGDPDYYKKLYEKNNCLGVEMESFALFHNARALEKNAACILTVSDSFVTEEAVPAQQREKSFTDMIEIALNTVKLINKR